MMRARLTTLALLTLSAALVPACSEQQPETTTNESGRAPAAVAPGSPGTGGNGPAGEVAPDSRAPAATPATASNLPEGVPAEFGVYFEKVPFTWGADAGLAKAKAAGKPAMLFYTADG